MVISILPYSHSSMENDPMLLVSYAGKLLAENNGVVRAYGAMPMSDILAEHGICNMPAKDAVRKVYGFLPHERFEMAEKFPSRLYYRDFNDLIVYVLKHTHFDTTQKRCAIEARANL